MAQKYIKDLTGTTNPSLSGYTIYDDGLVTYKTTLETLREVLVDSGSHYFTGSQNFSDSVNISGSLSVGGNVNTQHDITGALKISGSLNVNGSQYVKDFIFVSGFAVIGEPIHHMDDPEALHVGTKDSINIAHFAGNNNGYSQVFVKNLNSGSNSSTDLVVVSDNGTEDERYFNIGINSSTYNPNNGVGGPNDSYIINNGGTLWVGSLDGQTTKFFNIDYENPLITLFAGNYIGFGTQNISEDYKFEFSGSVYFENDTHTDGYTILHSVSESLNFNNDVEAEAAGIPLGGLYRSGSFIMIRLS
jgi:hypothetical protein